MKLSNKILIGFFAFIFVYVTAAFTELRLTGTTNVIDDKNSTAETVDLSSIRYLVINDLDKDVNIVGSDRSQLEVRSFAGDALKKLRYKISGDTLTLSDLESKDIQAIQITVFVRETGFTGITVNRAVAMAEKLKQDVLRISQNSGRLYISNSSIGKLDLDLSNRAQFIISETELDTVSAKIDGSDVHISSHVGLMEGWMKNAAFMQLTNIEEIQLKKDKSSRLNLYQ